MFRGINIINMDVKGRLAVPMRYREPLQLNRRQDSPYHVVVTIDTDSPCLLMYPASHWELIEQKLQELSSFNKATRRIQRLLIGHATELEIDKNGRLLIPPLLREYAELEKRIILVGQGKKFELWDESSWNKSRDAWLSEDTKGQEGLPDELLSLSL